MMVYVESADVVDKKNKNSGNDNDDDDDNNNNSNNVDSDMVIEQESLRTWESYVG